MKQAFLSLCIMSILIVSQSNAALLFTTSCNDPVLAIGQERTITISVYGDTLADDFGLHVWQLDMMPTSADGGVVEVVSATILDPVPNFSSGYDSINSPSGAVDWLGVAVLDGSQISDVGYDGFTPIAEVVIKGVAEGTVNYDLGDYGGGFYGIARGDVNTVDGTFDINSSVTTFSVVPEPSTLMILAGLSLLSRRRRKTA
jgi:hypothetical protein